MSIAKENGNEPISPSSVATSLSDDLYTTEEVGCRGLTKREYFAGLAMQGLITLKGSDCMDKDITAKQCVRMADALLVELSNGR